METNLNLDDFDLISIDTIEHLDQQTTFYDITIQDDHTFFIKIGNDYVLSHNCDGSHIMGLIINLFHQFWPNLIKEGILHRLKVPLIVATYGKNLKEFFSKCDYEHWAKEKNINHKMKYYKGLGGFSTDYFVKFLNDESYHEQLTYADNSDFECIDLAFDKSKADERKEWLLGS